MRPEGQTNGKREPIHPPDRWVRMTDRFSAAASIEPGQWVTHPDRPEWGMGQVQSAIGSRVTVNFEHQGKVLINADRVDLVIAG